MIKSWLSLSIPLIATLLLAGPIHAHFPWMVRGEDGRLSFFFGEGLSDRTYKLPPSLVGTEVFLFGGAGEKRQIPVSPVETEKFVGLQSESAIPDNALLGTHVLYGIYHGSRLDYYALAHIGKLPTSREAYNSLASGLELNAEIVDSEQGIDVFVSWKGKPVAEVEVHLYRADGSESVALKTNTLGAVSFSDKQVTAGLNAIMLGHTVPEAGKLKDASYESQSHYLTMTFNESKAGKGANADLGADLQLPDLPLELTSFGAARLGESIYIYGGHTGDSHSYSTGEQSNQLLQLDLKNLDSGWKSVSTGPRLQGLGMVAHKNNLILLGGFTALNAPGEEHDLHSQAKVLSFDTQTEEWSELPPLPEPRSSHDAAIVGNTIFVVGGWNMQGEEQTVWHQTAWKLDLSASHPEWSKIADPPFQHRALAVVANAERLFAIGGMDESNGPTKTVHIYDPQADSWSAGPNLPGEGSMAGFGASGWRVPSGLVVTTYEGDILQLADSKSSWELLGKTQSARFFHRLLPLEKNVLVSIGGANMNQGKFLKIETMVVR